MTTSPSAAGSPRGPRAADPASAADRAASFEHGVGVYAATRPSYPAQAVDWLLPVGAQRVLDLGAGTGKLTSALTGRGLDVVAVEPSAGMLEQLRADLPGVEAHLGTAEAVPLPDASVDAVLVAQAWHWFDARRASAEVARVLRPGGQVGIVWNDRDTSHDWVARFGEILHRGDALDPDHAHAVTAPALSDAFTTVESSVFGWVDRVRPDSLRPLAASRSYLLTLPGEERDALLDEVDTLVATHPALRGRAEVDLPYSAHAFRALLR